MARPRMQNQKLQAALEELRQEINSSGLSEGPSRDRLNTLITELEAKIARDEKDDAPGSLIEQVKDSIGHLELEYPKTTSILNQILTTLGGAGI